MPHAVEGDDLVAARYAPRELHRCFERIASALREENDSVVSQAFRHQG